MLQFRVFLIFSFLLLKHGVMASNIAPAWNSRNSLVRQHLVHGTSSRCYACWSHLMQIHSWLCVKGFSGSSTALQAGVPIQRVVKAWWLFFSQGSREPPFRMGRRDGEQCLQQGDTESTDTTQLSAPFCCAATSAAETSVTTAVGAKPSPAPGN